MSGKDYARGLAAAAIEARARAADLINRSSAYHEDDRAAAAHALERLAEWCDEQAAVSYDEAADPNRPRAVIRRITPDSE